MRGSLIRTIVPPCARPRTARAQLWDAIGALEASGQPCAGGEAEAAADESVGAKQAGVVLIIEVHRAATPAGHPGGAAKQLGEQRRGVVALGVVVVEAVEGLGDGVAVAAVGGGDHVSSTPARHGPLHTWSRAGDVGG